MSRQLSPAMAIAMLVMVLAGFAACSDSISSPEESQINNTQDKFEGITKQWMDKLKKEIELRKRNYIIEIDSLSIELSSYKLTQYALDSISRGVLGLVKEVGQLEKIQWEIEYLSKSNQPFLVVEDDTLGVWAFTSFDNKSHYINIHITPVAPISLFAHELLHVYQFERGLISLGDPAKGTGKHFLRDSTDEIAAYKRQEMFNDTVAYEGVVLPKGPNSIYNFNRDTSAYQVNLPELIKKGDIKDLKTVADSMRQAYRVQLDGKWVTITMN